MEIDSLSSLERREILLTDIRNAIEVEWSNPMKMNNDDAVLRSALTMSDIDSAYARLRRFAPLMRLLFPETEDRNGMIDSDLVEVSKLKRALNNQYMLARKAQAYQNKSKEVSDLQKKLEVQERKLQNAEQEKEQKSSRSAELEECRKFIIAKRSRILEALLVSKVLLFAFDG